MILIIITLLVLWTIVGVSAFLVWRYRESDDLKFLPIMMQSLTIGIGLSGVIISLYTLSRTMKVERGSIVPRLQVVPQRLSTEAQLTNLTIAVRNLSDYDAVKIYIDVKLGDAPWANELHSAVSKESFYKLLGQDVKNNFQEQHENFLNRPTIETIQAGKGLLFGVVDTNRHFLKRLEGHVQERLPDGSVRTVPIEETSDYKSSLGWFDALSKANSKNPLVLLIHARWQNLLGRHFEQIISYRIEITRSGSMSSIAFLPDKLLFENY